jgi:hypothetical protein
MHRSNFCPGTFDVITLSLSRDMMHETRRLITGISHDWQMQPLLNHPKDQMFIHQSTVDGVDVDETDHD